MAGNRREWRKEIWKLVEKNGEGGGGDDDDGK